MPGFFRGGSEETSACILHQILRICRVHSIFLQIFDTKKNAFCKVFASIFIPILRICPEFNAAKSVINLARIYFHPSPVPGREVVGSLYPSTLPSVHFEGSMFPVEAFFLEDALRWTGTGLSESVILRNNETRLKIRQKNTTEKEDKVA